MIFEVSTDDEIKEVKEVLIPFYKTLQISQNLEDAKKVFCSHWKNLIRLKTGRILALEKNNKIVGALGFVIFNSTEDGKLCCSEQFWYVNERHRGDGMKLFLKFEKIAKSLDAKRLFTTHQNNIMPEKLRRIYEKMGYKSLQTIYLKEL